MARSAILPLRTMSTEIDIFSNKSSLISFWLLAHHRQAKKEGFSLNEMERNTEISIGLIHKVIKQLEYIGIVSSTGLRTNKKFFLKSPDKLLISWVKEYNLIKKSKSKGFSASNFEAIKNFEKLGLVPALHTASANFFKLKTTNLRLQEFYLLNWKKLPDIASRLNLQELDRGYEILLIKPYYSALLERMNDLLKREVWLRSYEILTILDLCHFPVRGVEQAESLFKKNDFFQSICQWSEIENAIR